jgi:regulator of sigma E protease
MFAEAGLQDGDVIETINGEYFETSRDFFRLLQNYGTGTVELSGQRIEPREPLNVQLTVNPDEAALLADAGGRLIVTTVQENSPANAAGILPGDAIISLGRVSLATGDSPFETLRTVNLANEGKEISIELIREGEPLTLNIVPRINPAAGIGHLGASVLTEFVTAENFVYGDGGQQFDYVPLPFGEALGYGAQQIGTILQMILDLPVRLLSGQAQPEEGRVISIVGITQLGGEFLQQSIEEEQPILILRFIALVSIALGITNLLPLPPLDGGRILFVIIEMVRGKPMSARREEMLLMIGVVFLLSVGVLVIINDILNPITNSLTP